MIAGRSIVRQPEVATVLAVVAQIAVAATGSAGALDCGTPVRRTDDEASLAARFGRTNVAAVDLDGAEGTTERGTAIFPKDPVRRVEVFWFDADRRRRPSSIRMRGRGGWTVTVAGATTPIAVGSSLAAVEAVNGRAFTLIGFGWDMGGYGGGWRGGALDRFPGGCSLSLRFDPEPNRGGRALDKVSGDRRLSSDAPAVRAVAPRVSQISLDWPD